MISRYFMIGLLLFALVGKAMAAEYTVEWGYTPPSEPAVAGFRLYKNNTQIAEFTGASTTTGVFTDTLTIGDTFELSALFADTTESPRSSPYAWNGVSSWIRFGRFNPGNSHGRTDKLGQVRIQ